MASEERTRRTSGITGGEAITRERTENQSTVGPERYDSQPQRIERPGASSVSLFSPSYDRQLQRCDSTPSSYLSPGVSSDTFSSSRSYIHDFSCNHQTQDIYNRSENNPCPISDAPTGCEDSAFQQDSIPPQYSLGCSEAYSGGTPANTSVHTHPDFAVAELMSLRYMPSRFADVSASVSHGNQNDGETSTGSIPETREGPAAASLFQHGFLDDQLNLPDDIFLPGSAYEALHTTLRNRQLGTARTSAPSRQESPASILNVRSLVNDPSDRVEPENDPSRTGKLVELTPYREYVLWQNYLEEICSWVRFPRDACSD